MTKITDAQKSYLADVLGKNPTWQSTEILTARAGQLGLVVCDRRNERSQEMQDYTSKKSALRQQLQEIRDSVWTGSVDELNSRLADLSYEGSRELGKLGKRLQVIVDNRNKLDQLIDHRGFDKEFFECFKMVLTTPPRESAVLRQRVLVSFNDRQLRAKGKGTIRLLQREAEGLCSLEKDWLDSLRGVSFIQVFRNLVAIGNPENEARRKRMLLAIAIAGAVFIVAVIITLVEFND